MPNRFVAPPPRAGVLTLACIALGFVAASCGEDVSGTGGETATSSETSTTGSGAGCKLGFIGDPNGQIEMRVVARGADELSHELADGDEVAMILPPQGGRVIFVGAKVNNVDPCAVILSGVLRDTTSSLIRLDERTVNLKPDAEGWGAPVESDISTYSNIPLCPNSWASTSLYDNPFELEITIRDRGGRTATQKLTVTPKCAESQFEAECLCQCQQDYMLGQACP